MEHIMSLAQTALAIPAVAAIAHEYVHGPIAYSAACKQIAALGYTDLEAGLILAEAIIATRVPTFTLR